MKCINEAGTAIQNDAAYIRISWLEDLTTWTTYQIKVKSQAGNVDLTLTATVYAGDTTNRTMEARCATNDLSDLGAYKAWGYIADGSGGFHTEPIRFSVLELSY